MKGQGKRLSTVKSARKGWIEPGLLRTKGRNCTPGVSACLLLGPLKCQVWHTPAAGVPLTFFPMPKTAAAKAPAPPANYEAALQELEQLVAALDAGQLPLDQLLAQYQRGAELLRFCRSQLDAVEQQIRVFENGSSQPWSAQ